MKTHDLIVRCLGKKDGDQWVVVCLDYSLAGQGETLDEAKKSVEAQIVTYLKEALVGQDREHASVLLFRRAPLKYWLMYYAALCAHGIMNNKLWKAFQEPVPLKPAHA